MADLRTYSVVINWDDGEPEKGTYGETVRARDDEHAARIVRASMMRSKWEEWARIEKTMTKSDVAEMHSRQTFDGVQYFGSVVECSEGASWKAADLEKALRGLLGQVDEVASRCGWADHGEREAARKLIAEIDAL